MTIKNKTLFTLLSSIVVLLTGQQVVAASNLSLYSQMPHTCPILLNIAQQLDISNVSQKGHGNYKIEQINSYGTDYRWTFELQINAQSKADALAKAAQMLHTSPEPTYEAVFDTTNNQLVVKCYSEEDDYSLTYQANCKANSHFFTQSFTCHPVA